ncbi:MAG: F0F1 ATP synthase subunit A [Desulfotomaculaceae bacterium]|nr:F0F1 ATP synthase subunit A [Desulfotomaculaceae bacterium]
MLSLHEVESRLDLWGGVFKLWERDSHNVEIMWNLNLAGINLEFSMRTMVMTWIVMILVVVFCVAATRKLDMRRPGGLQNVMEIIFEMIRGQINQAMDPQKGSSIISIIMTFLIFILFSNLLGLIPTLMSPTANPNTAFALSLTTFALIWFYGIKYKGIRYFSHWFKPNIVFLPINLIEEFVKPVTLAARLFGNIYAGEVLICTWLGMFTGWYYLTGGFIAEMIWLAFSVFVSVIQAYIFSVLSINYIGSAMTTEDH